MTLHAVTCPVCKRTLGLFHDHQISAVLARHIKKEHPAEAKKLRDIVDKIQALYTEFEAIAPLRIEDFFRHD